MTHSRRAWCTLATALVLMLSSTSAPTAQRVNEGKPSLSLRATPPVGFTPLRVRVAVDVRGGPDDYQDFYCPTIEWNWGNGTISESSEDCAPYEAGTSTIRRRFTAEYVYRQSGSYQIAFRLKQGSKAVAVATATVQVRGGARDGF